MQYRAALVPTVAAAVRAAAAHAAPTPTTVAAHAAVDHIHMVAVAHTAAVALTVAVRQAATPVAVAAMVVRLEAVDVVAEPILSNTHYN